MGMTNGFAGGIAVILLMKFLHQCRGACLNRRFTRITRIARIFHPLWRGSYFRAFLGKACYSFDEVSSSMLWS
jgi:hypothetical protein